MSLQLFRTTGQTSSSRIRLGLGVTAVVVVLSATLTGCASLGGAATGASAVGAGAAETGTASPIDRFTACLRSEGLETNVTSEGFLAVQFEHGEDLLEGQIMSLSVPASEADNPEFAGRPMMAWTDSQGLPWVVPADADFFVTAPVAQDSWLACETQVPEFTQLTWNDVQNTGDQDAIFAEWFDAALAFAGRARAAGFEWVADPTPELPGINLPAHLSEAEFRAVLEAAWEPGIPGFVWLLAQASAMSFEQVGEVLEDFPATAGWGMGMGG